MSNPRPTNENDRGRPETFEDREAWVSEVEPNTENAVNRPI